MPLFTINPTANETPDATLGGGAVSGATNTGHTSTLTPASGGSSSRKSARWFSFVPIAGTISAITLKIDHTSSGALSGPTPTNQFTLEYSTNGGGAWNPAASRTNFVGAQGPTTFSVGLAISQNVAQVQVRVLYDAGTTDIGDSASITATIANIKLEVNTVDSFALSGGM
jgi:hypothetical protein